MLPDWPNFERSCLPIFLQKKPNYQVNLWAFLMNGTLVAKLLLFGKRLEEILAYFLFQNLVTLVTDDFEHASSVTCRRW